MSAAVERARELEEVAGRAWVAAEEEPLGGWRLRASSGVTQRGNSVWPNSDDGSLSLEAKLTAVEAFYAARGLPARYQMTVAAVPADLDAELAARGYALICPCLVMTAAVGEVTAQAGEGDGVMVAEAPDEAWLDAWLSLEDVRPEQRAARTAFLGRTKAAQVFAAGRVEGVTAAVGRGALDGGWLGVFGMATRPAFRRRGLARAVLGALAAWGAVRGAGRMYLQVIEANVSARALYDATGFTVHHGYHYRERVGELRP
jgi:GNAT superfamily N-acetyltransferase